MTEAPTGRLAIVWSVDARSDLRRIDRGVALEILHCVDRFLTTRNGDVKKLKPPQSGYRLRCGDYRVFFEYAKESSLEVLAVRHRREAYR